MPRFTIMFCVAILADATQAEEHVQLGIRLPTGFEVTEFAGPALANDIFALTIDGRGRVVVSGRGYIRILVDDDQDGGADRAIAFADGPADGAQGLLWEHSSLFVTGDGGLRRYHDDDGDDRADGSSELIRLLKTGGEHDAHDIKRGPDGWLYVLCGNMTGVDSRFAPDSTSPIREPVAGCVIRFAPDLTTSEIVADGFRNAYRMDFNHDGALFTYDSDNERCTSLPWYEPTRFYHVIAGGHYGWLAPQRAQFWRLPPYSVDVVAPVAYVGRGSPTGVACYRHEQFPAEYRGGFFLADWTFGRIHFVATKRNGSSFGGTARVFLEAVGENGFAPTDLAVHPITGDLYVSIGGRGTRGAIYRVRYIQASETATNYAMHARSPITIGDAVQLASSGDDATRLLALQTIQRNPYAVTRDQLHKAIVANWENPDRNLRCAVASLIDRTDTNELSNLDTLAQRPLAKATLAHGSIRTDPSRALKLADEALCSAQHKAARMTAVRVVQLALGDVCSMKAAGTVWEGYTPHADLARTNSSERQPDALRGLAARACATIAKQFPAGDPELDRELARTLAVVEAEHSTTVEKVATRLTKDSSPVDDIHYLAVLARLHGKRSEDTTARVAHALLALDRKCEELQLNRDRNWPLRVAEVHLELARQDPALNEVLLADPEFGRPDHVLFVQGDGFDRTRAAAVFLSRAKADAAFTWNARLIELVGALSPAESKPLLRGLWDNIALRDAILRLLSRDPQVEDRAKFISGIEATQWDTVSCSLSALESLPTAWDSHELLALLRIARRLRDSPEESRIRSQVQRLLLLRTGQTMDVSDTKAWSDWFGQKYPEFVSRLAGSDSVDMNAWRARLEAIDWSGGDADRGRGVFARAACLACHSGPRAIGPDLRGAANRFAREDLITAILQPSRDVSPRYHVTRVASADGKVYQGVIIYDAVDSLILQTGADTTIRFTGNQIVERTVTPNSLMPAGLLDELSDTEIADLFAYLKTLR